MNTTSDLGQVRGLIERLAPAAICEGCIGRTRGIPADEAVDQMTHELAGTNGFDRRRDRCSLCGRDIKVICSRRS